MSVLFADEPLPILEGIALAASSFGLILASASRMWSRRPGDPVEQLFWRDVSQAGYIWAAGTIVLQVGTLGEIEGLRVPIWLLLAMVAGVGLVAIAGTRWRGYVALSGRSSADAGEQEPRRLASTSWEVAMLVGGASGLLFYGLAISHSWSHPVHWLVAGIGVAIGYAIGLVAATPRYTAGPASN